MKRRSFLKGLFAAPVAAPAALSEMTKGVEWNPGLSSLDTGQVGPAKHWGGPVSDVYSVENYVSSMRKELARYLENVPPLEHFIRSVSRFDADITTLRSLSLSARIRMQAERNRTRDIEQTTGSIRRSIENALGVKS